MGNPLFIFAAGLVVLGVAASAWVFWRFEFNFFDNRVTLYTSLAGALPWAAASLLACLASPPLSSERWAFGLTAIVTVPFVIFDVFLWFFLMRELAWSQRRRYGSYSTGRAATHLDAWARKTGRLQSVPADSDAASEQAHRADAAS